MKKAILLALLLFAAGCETLAPRVEGPANQAAWEARRAWLASLERWQLEGRVAIAAYGEGWNASLEWRQDGERLDVHFSGPLGVGSASVTGTPERLEVRTADGEHFVTRNPESDLYWQLGWTAPLDRMPYWVLGLPGPGADFSLEVDGAGRPVRLVQAGWTVDYIDYLLLDTEPAAHALPRKIEMRREDVRIRLVVGEWMLDKT